MLHIAENVVFFQSELGIRARFPRAFCTCIQSTKRGIVATVAMNRSMFAGSRMLDRFPAIILCEVSNKISLVPRVGKTLRK